MTLTELAEHALASLLRGMSYGAIGWSLDVAEYSEQEPAQPPLVPSLPE